MELTQLLEYDFTFAGTVAVVSLLVTFTKNNVKWIKTSVQTFWLAAIYSVAASMLYWLLETKVGIPKTAYYEGVTWAGAALYGVVIWIGAVFGHEVVSGTVVERLYEKIGLEKPDYKKRKADHLKSITKVNSKRKRR